MTNAFQNFISARREEYQKGTIFDRCRGLSLAEFLLVDGCFDGLSESGGTIYRKALVTVRDFSDSDLPFSDHALSEIQAAFFVGDNKQFQNCLTAINYAHYITGRDGKYQSGWASNGEYRGHFEALAQCSVRSPHPDEGEVVRRCVKDGLALRDIKKFCRISGPRVAELYNQATAPKPMATPKIIAAPKPDIQPVTASPASSDRRAEPHDDIVSRLAALTTKHDELQTKVEKLIFGLEHPNLSTMQNNELQAIGDHVLSRIVDRLGGEA